MADLERELKKVRDESAQRRIELTPFKKAFGNFDDDAKEWLLEAIEMIHKDPVTAGERFANLAIGNMGAENFSSWANGNLELSERIGDNTDMAVPTENQDSDEVDVTDWAMGLEKRIMDSLEQREQATAKMFQERDRASQFKEIRETITGLGYDPDSWQGRMLVSTATSEIDQSKPVSVRLQEADTIVRERLGGNVQSAPAPEAAPTLASNQVPSSLEVPSTGAEIGGGGIPDISGEDPISFNDANDALNQLLKSEIGQ